MATRHVIQPTWQYSWFFRFFGFTTSEMLLRRSSTRFPLLLAGLFASLLLACYFLQARNSHRSSIFKNTPLKQPIIVSKRNGKFNPHFILLYLMFGIVWNAMLPWVPEDMFFLIDTDGLRRSRVNEEKNNLWSQEYATSFPCEKSVQNLSWFTDWILPCQIVRCSQSGPLLYC